jgi:chemotaxis protein methyltransferase CheR
LTADRSGQELLALLDVVSTNETSFFRTPAHFDWFESTFIPEVASTLQSTRRLKRLLVWSAASSTGEEAYSLAMLLDRNRKKLPGVEIRVIGTDISTSVVQQAKEATYSTDAVQKLPAEFQSYFEPHGSQMRVIERVRKLTEFRTHNLMKPAPERDLDCVFVRNVLIYFDRQSKAVVINHVINGLKLDGYLVVGPSEGILTVPDGLVRRQSFLFQRV